MAWIVGISIAALGVLLVTGGFRRLGFRAFCLRPERMTVHRLGLSVGSQDVERIDRILSGFAGGFNAMITARSESAWRAHCDSLPALVAPFAHEGTAMGYTLRRLGRFGAEEFEQTHVLANPGMRYLHYVGLGFWWGMRNRTPHFVMGLTEGLDPLHRSLCFDGYGFKVAFFDYPKNPQAFATLAQFTGYARNAAYHGVGRALWFRFMSPTSRLLQEIEQLGPHAVDAVAGVGLAVTFVNPDRFHVARDLALQLPLEWRNHFHLGMCFGLKARSINQPLEFGRWMDRENSKSQAAVGESIAACDRIEQSVRAGHPDQDGYRLWRVEVTDWMAENIIYPMVGMVNETTASVGGQSRPVQRIPVAAEIG